MGFGCYFQIPKRLHRLQPNRRGRKTGAHLTVQSPPPARGAFYQGITCVPQSAKRRSGRLANTRYTNREDAASHSPVETNASKSSDRSVIRTMSPALLTYVHSSYGVPSCSFGSVSSSAPATGTLAVIVRFAPLPASATFAACRRSVRHRIVGTVSESRHAADCGQGGRRNGVAARRRWSVTACDRAAVRRRRRAPSLSRSQRRPWRHPPLLPSRPPSSAQRGRAPRPSPASRRTWCPARGPSR